MSLELLYFAWVREAIGRTGRGRPPPGYRRGRADRLAGGAAAAAMPGAGRTDQTARRGRPALRALDAPIAGAREMRSSAGDRRMIGSGSGRAVRAGVELARLEALAPGAVASFTGLVRGDDGLVAMELGIIRR